MSTENYSKEAVAALRAGYDPQADEATRNAQVKALAETFAKSVPSIRAKLSRMGVYVAKTYKNKQGNEPTSKAALVNQIAEAVGVEVETFDSLEKANKAVLIKVRDALADFMEASQEVETEEVADVS